MNALDKLKKIKADREADKNARQDKLNAQQAAAEAAFAPVYDAWKEIKKSVCERDGKIHILLSKICFQVTDGGHLEFELYCPLSHGVPGTWLRDESGTLELDLRGVALEDYFLSKLEPFVKLITPAQ